MADKSEIRMNLAAIKKVDPYAKDIIDSSAHVAFYTYSSVDNEWEKTDIEGAFFIYCRNAEPYQSIFINNRLNTNSFVEPITSQLELQSQPPFLLYRNERSRIRGFWFYNSAECDRIGELVRSLIRESEVKNKMPQKENVEAKNNVDIFSMLSKAQQNFNIHTMMSNKAPSQVAYKPTNLPPPTKTESDMTSESVLNFFAAAKPTSAAASEVPFFQRLLSNPVSVDQIEKQQRSTSPVDIIQANSCDVASIENRNHIPKGVAVPSSLQADLGISPLAKFLGATSLRANDKLESKPSPLANKIRQPHEPIGGGGSDFSGVVVGNVPPSSSSSKPALMPPTMFATSNSSTLNDVNQHQPRTISDPENILAPLTQTQLVQALTYLIKNDPGFIKQLHEAYLKSFTEMVSL